MEVPDFVTLVEWVTWLENCVRVPSSSLPEPARFPSGATGADTERITINGGEMMTKRPTHVPLTSHSCSLAVMELESCTVFVLLPWEGIVKIPATVHTLKS